MAAPTTPTKVSRAKRSTTRTRPMRQTLTRQRSESNGSSPSGSIANGTPTPGAPPFSLEFPFLPSVGSSRAPILCPLLAAMTILLLLPTKPMKLHADHSVLRFPGLGREDKLVRFTGVKTVNFLYSASLTVLKTGFINVA